MDELGAPYVSGQPVAAAEVRPLSPQGFIGDPTPDQKGSDAAGHRVEVSALQVSWLHALPGEEC